MEVNLINSFLIKKKYSILNCFILENISYLTNDIDLIHNFLIKSNYMMFCCNLNSKIEKKKIFLFNLIRMKKRNSLLNSIISAYIVYFYIIAKINQDIFISNENIRNNIDIEINESKISELILSANKLNFKTINFSTFFGDNNNIFMIENHLN